MHALKDWHEVVAFLGKYILAACSRSRLLGNNTRLLELYESSRERARVDLSGRLLQLTKTNSRLVQKEAQKTWRPLVAEYIGGRIETANRFYLHRTYNYTLSSKNRQSNYRIY